MPDRQPLKSYGHLVEYQAGAHAALGILAALHAREVTGRGQLVDASAMEAATFMLGAVEQSAYFYGRVSRRNGTRLLGFPPEQPYPSTIRPCRDGYVHCHSNNRHRDLLGALIPNSRLLDDDIVATPMGYADDIDAMMDEWLIERDRDEIVAAAQELRLPFTEVMSPGEVLTVEHHKLRGSFVDLQHPVAGSVLQPGFPFRMTGSPPVLRPAPLLGEHSADALTLPAAPTRAPQQAPAGYRPLNGVRVLDFTNAVAGPIAGFILADLGADVIKVEGPAGRPRKAPHTAPLAEGGEDLPWNRIMNYNELNHGKRGVSLDVAKAEGRDLFLGLVEQSDVVVQNFSPRVMFNLGIDYETLRAVNPRIVMLSIPAFGLDGPYRDRIAYGPGVDAMSGLAHLSGYADGPPMKPGNFFCDQQSGVLGALAVQAALWQRRTTGEGQHIELAMIEGEFQVLADAYIDYQWNGRERMRCGNDHPQWAPHDTYRCQGEDAWVAIAVENDEQWQALCAVIGRDDLAADERFLRVSPSATPTANCFAPKSKRGPPSEHTTRRRKRSRRRVSPLAPRSTASKSSPIPMLLRATASNTRMSPMWARRPTRASPLPSTKRRFPSRKPPPASAKTTTPSSAACSGCPRTSSRVSKNLASRPAFPRNTTNGRRNHDGRHSQFG